MTKLKLLDDGLDWREVDGELIALERAESVYLAANPSATILWRALARGATEEELADQLSATYGIAHERASADAARFVADLRTRGLLKTA
jgi:hypothetical protein